MAELGIGMFSGMFSGMGGFIKSAIIGGIVIGCVGIIAWFIFSYVRNKSTFNIPVRLIKISENGTTKALGGLRGGKVKGRTGVTTFVVKMKMQKKDLGFMPNFSKCDGDGTLTFITNGDGTLWQQVDVKLQSKENIEVPFTQEELLEIRKHIIEQYSNELNQMNEEQREYSINHVMADYIKDHKKTISIDLLMKPIPTDNKTATVNNLANWRAILDKNKMNAFTIAIGAILLMIIAHLISLYIQTKIRCPTG